ncbi:Hypothetical predicted protein [Marmota monax]|uniref:Uncharacterized protein n=1 Tax=Marmota monax TaxID=9995 RepID=A0A5E4BEX8_MARMO|nr:hypothetical protein GHT09_012380 [Marmota monax]VTJ68118.1 Hypothetical predicted protein [Marmota monax]
MRTPLLPQAPVVLLLLILGSGHHAVGLDLNDTDSGKGEPLSKNHSTSGPEVASRNETTPGIEISPVTETPSSTEVSSGTDYDYLEYDAELQISGYIVDDSVRGK